MRQLIEIDFTATNRTNVYEVLSGTSVGNNVSNADVLATHAGGGNGYKGFVFAKVHGEWPALSDGNYRYFPEEGYRGYMSKALSSADGSVNISIVFNLVGETPSYLSLQFDRVCNEFATQMRISNNQNNNTITINNRAHKSFAVINSLGITSGAILTVTILKWNKPFKNVKITNILFGFVGEFDENTLDSFRCSENLLTENFNITPGILEQFADITFRDKYEELATLSRAELLNRDIEVRVYALDDTDLDEEELPRRYLQGVYITDTWKVDGTSNQVTLNCTDVSQKFANIAIPPVEIRDRTLHDIFDLIFFYTSQFNFSYIDTATEEYCKNIFTPNSWMYGGTLEELLIKALKLGKMRAYWFIDKFLLARCY